MGEGDALSDSQVRLYRHLVAFPLSPLSDAAQKLQLDVNGLRDSAATLVEIGLLELSGIDTYSARSPMLAEVVELGAEELELSARRAAVESRRRSIRQVIPDWIEMLRQAPGQAAVDVINDRASMGNVLMHFAERCERELLSVSPGRGPGRADPRTRMANLYSLGRGVKTRSLYQHMALRDRATRAYLRELAENGARIRLASSVPGRSLVIDREVALLTIPGREPSSSAALAVVREPTVVSWVAATFEQLWAEASPLDQLLGQQQPDTEIDQTRAAILRLMAEGEKDEAISRRLSISVRTCRRHIADYMAQVGATSRFQAGVVAARDGHLDVAPIPGLPALADEE
jgi:DNA-binding NarL/FixJ family response regulator